jgi:aminotransferase
MIQIFSNTLGEQELSAVEQVFKSRWVGRGKECKAFEKEFAAHLGVKNVLLFNSCTAATYTMLDALWIGEGDEVIVPSIQFVGVANAIIDHGAMPVFADVDPHTLNILPSEIERLRTEKTKAVFLLHYGGHPAPMNDILEASRELLVLEDAANAVSSTYYGFSMVDGGALWIKGHTYQWRTEILRYFGLPVKNNSGIDSAKKGNGRWWEYELLSTSGRHISNDVMAAIGRVQLSKLDRFIDVRKRIWARYQCDLAGVGDLALPPEPLQFCNSSYYLYWIQTERRDELARFLLENDIYTTFRYYPLHLVGHYGSDASLPNAESVNETTLCLPLHQNLSNSDVSYIVDKVQEFFGG